MSSFNYSAMNNSRAAPAGQKEHAQQQINTTTSWTFYSNSNWPQNDSLVLDLELTPGFPLPAANTNTNSNNNMPSNGHDFFQDPEQDFSNFNNATATTTTAVAAITADDLASFFSNPHLASTANTTAQTVQAAPSTAPSAAPVPVAAPLLSFPSSPSCFSSSANVNSSASASSSTSNYPLPPAVRSNNNNTSANNNNANNNNNFIGQLEATPALTIDGTSFRLALPAEYVSGLPIKREDQFLPMKPQAEERSFYPANDGFWNEEVIPPLDLIINQEDSWVNEPTSPSHEQHQPLSPEAPLDYAPEYHSTAAAPAPAASYATATAAPPTYHIQATIEQATFVPLCNFNPAAAMSNINSNTATTATNKMVSSANSMSIPHRQPTAASSSSSSSSSMAHLNPSAPKWQTAAAGTIRTAIIASKAAAAAAAAAAAEAANFVVPESMECKVVRPKERSNYGPKICRSCSIFTGRTNQPEAHRWRCKNCRLVDNQPTAPPRRVKVQQPELQLQQQQQLQLQQLQQQQQATLLPPGLQQEELESQASPAGFSTRRRQTNPRQVDAFRVLHIRVPDSLSYIKIRQECVCTFTSSTSGRSYEFHAVLWPLGVQAQGKYEKGTRPMKIFIRDFNEWGQFLEAEGPMARLQVVDAELTITVAAMNFNTRSFIPAPLIPGTMMDMFWFSGEHDYFDQEVYECLKAKKRIKYSGGARRF